MNRDLYIKASGSGSGSPKEWLRPNDWLPMPTNITSANQTFVGLYAIFPEGQNYAAFLFTTSAGQYQVDWGDGTTTLHNSNTIAQKDFNYATISNSTLTSRGYKQSMITVTAVSGNLLTCNFQQRFVTSPVQNQAYSTGFLDCILTMPNASSGASISFGGGTVRHSYVERFNILTIGICTDLNILFFNCYSLQSVPLFNTQNVTNMVSMFNNCRSLQSVPLFNTQNVTLMNSMFAASYSLISIPLFNTENVTNMSSTFAGCVSLISIPLFNTVKVTTMVDMFQGCNSLQSVPFFNTQNVTTMVGMFANCYPLQSVPLFNTIKVTNMQGMFTNCNSLQSVPLFNTVNVTNMSTTFIGCVSLTSIPLLNTVNVTTMVQMFNNCYSLQTVPLFDTQNVTLMGSMFSNCFSLQTVPLFNTIKVTNMNNMFSQCVCLQTLPLFNTVNVTNFVSFIPNSFSIQSIPNFSTNSITTALGSNFTSIFDSCSSLDRIQMIFSRPVSMTNCQLSRTALVEIFTNLVDRTSTTPANINITGNWGATALTVGDRLIATAKNWTITG